MPRKQFPSRPTPEWLEKISPDSAFNREDVIDKSIYYPGSYVDGSPLAAYGGFCHSFVYVDYYVTNDEIRSYIPRIAGYEPIFIKDVSKTDLSPYPVHQHHPRASDFYENNNRLTIDELMENFKPHRRQETNPPFCLWTVLQRKARTNPSHGPSRMSLLYICGDGAATYEAIYNSNKLCPLAIIICGAETGFGGNWTRFEMNGGILERIAMGNPAGHPKYLFTWFRYDESPDEEIRDSYYYQIKMYWNNYTKKIPDRNYLTIYEYQDLN